MMKQSHFEIVRQELDSSNAALPQPFEERLVSLLRSHLPEYQPVEVKQCFTKIRKEIEKQRDLFWGHPCDNLPWQPMLRCRCAWRFMREALWLYRSSVS